MSSGIEIRLLNERDADLIAQAFAAQGWDKPPEQYLGYVRQGLTGERTSLVAEVGKRFAGYVTIVWASAYGPFRAAGIPEIVDLNVLQCHQRQGVGTALMAAAELRIAARSPVAGIAVGLTADYGAAQVMYVRRGYVPDGRGIHRHGYSVSSGTCIAIDDHVVLYLTKELL